MGKVKNKSLLFSVGPVEMDPKIGLQGAKGLPYFRTEEFSQVNKEICSMLKSVAGTHRDSKVVLLTASGTGAMEAAVENTFTHKDKILVVCGGSFGWRFKEICDVHNLKSTVIKLQQGETLKRKHLEPFIGRGYTGLLTNGHETSTGVYYDLPMIGKFCKQERILFVVDAISTFLADPYYMDEWNIDITILSTQKALALPPGMSILIINERVSKRIYHNKVKSLYFNLKTYFEDIHRGQTPYTPAVSILLQLHARLKEIKKVGVQRIILDTAKLAVDFRTRIRKLPFTIPSEKLSNAVTPLQPRAGISAYDIFRYLKEHYNIIVCPNGGAMRDSLFRVGHMGHLKIKDNTRLIKALNETRKAGLV
jgi:aspartate aminotransferase-like enzyme